MEKEQESNKKPSILNVISSVLAAFFGVQSNKNRERDFKHGNFTSFVIVGLIATIGFIGILITVVNIMLKNSGA